MLFQSPWLKADKTEVFRNLKIDFLRFDMKILDGHYYFLAEDLEKLYAFVEKQLESNPAWFEEYFSICNKKSADLLAIENGVDLKEFLNRMIESFGCSFLVELIDRGVERHLKEKCGQAGVQFSKITSYIKFPRPTELMKYKAALQKLDKSNPKAIDDFVQKFAWVTTHAFSGKPLSKSEVLDALAAGKPLQGKKETPKSFQGLPRDFLEIIRIASELSFYRSNLIETVARLSYGYWKKLEETGKKHGLSFEEVTSLTEDELFNLIDNGTKALPNDLKKRGTDFGLVFLDHKLTILLGNATLEELAIHNTEDFSRVREVQGMCAFPGKVSGRAKIVFELKDVAKVLPGDILIASETVPGFVVAMEKASAFVTDVGGLTCHAAIIAREMKKPCVIATKVATKVFKDNELVEVDATNGIVKKVQ